MARLLLIRERPMSVPVRSKAVWYPRRRFLPLVATLALALIVPSFAIAAARPSKLDGELVRRSQRKTREVTSVIVTLVPGATLPQEFKRFARVTGRLGIINGAGAGPAEQRPARSSRRGPKSSASTTTARPTAHNFRTSIASGARAVQQGLGFTGAGIGVAVIDSGITTWHDDLTSPTRDAVPVRRPAGHRVCRFRERPARSVRRQRPRHARRRHHRRQRPRFAGRECGHRARRVAGLRSKCSTRRAAARSATSSRRSTGCWPTDSTTSASSTSRSARRCASRTGPTR